MALAEFSKDGKVLHRERLGAAEPDGTFVIRPPVVLTHNKDDSNVVRLESGQEAQLGDLTIRVLAGEDLALGSSHTDIRRGNNELPGSATWAVEDMRQAVRADERPLVPGYVVSEKLGEGGMSTVWRAVQTSTGRDVALKLITPGRSRATSLARFQREVEITARLDHPNIARIYDSRVFEGMYCYAMELIDGVDLGRHCEQYNLNDRQRLEMMLMVCSAVQHAHQHGVIHRDLKLTNVMTTRDGVPKVLDFGLATTLLESDSGSHYLTMAGGPIGTPAYMSPEQVAGRLQHIDTRTDVYALGAMLYHLLTGQLPFSTDGSLIDVMSRISRTTPRRPRELRADLDAELEAILLKAVSREREHRYATAGELGQDLANYLAGEPLVARTPTVGYFLRKKLAKHKLAVAIVSAAATVLIALVVSANILILRQRDRALAAESEAKAQAAKAQEISAFLQRVLTAASPSQRGRSVKVTDALAAAEHQIAESLRGQPQLESAVRATLGVTYFALDDYRSAELQLRPARELAAASLGPQHPDTVWISFHLARLLEERGRHGEAEPLLREVLAERERTRGVDHPETKMVLVMLADVLNATGRLEQAKPLVERTLTARLDLMTQQIPATVGATNYRTAALITRDMAPTAIREYTRLANQRAEVYSPADPRALIVEFVLGVVQVRTGAAAEALDRLQRAQRGYRQVLGLEHPYVGFCAWYIAEAHMALNRPDDAIAGLRELADEYSRTLGPEHGGTLKILVFVSEFYERAGRLAEAEDVARGITDIQTRTQGDDYPSAYVVYLLAKQQLKQGKYAEAERHARRALRLSETWVGEGDRATLRARGQLIELLQMQGKLAEAIPLAEQQWRLREKLSGPNHPDTQAARQLLEKLRAGL